MDPPTLIKNLTTNETSHFIFISELQKLCQPQFDLSDSKTSLSSTALLDFFESVLVYGNDHQLSDSAIIEFFEMCKNVLVGVRDKRIVVEGGDGEDDGEVEKIEEELSYGQVQELIRNHVADFLRFFVYFYRMIFTILI